MWANFVAEFCTGTGDVLTHTGPIDSDALPFSSQIADGKLVSYIVKDSGGTIKAAGIGVYSGGQTTRADSWQWDGTQVILSPETNIPLSDGVHVIYCGEHMTTLKSNVYAVTQKAGQGLPLRPEYEVVHWYSWDEPVINHLNPYDQWLQIPEIMTGYAVVLLIGQSNMVGSNGPIDPVLDASNERIFQLRQSTGEIALATNPLDHWNEGSNTIGLGLTFAKQLLADIPPTQDILLIPAARGSSGFGTGWEVDGYLRDYALLATNTALAENPGSQLVAILWHQGESNSEMSESEYAASLDGLIAQCRAEISGATNVPFVVGDIPIWGTWHTEALSAAIENTITRVSYTGFVETDDLSPGVSDSTHFNAASLRIMGQRYYEQFEFAKTNVVGSEPVVPEAIDDLVASPGEGQVILSFSAPASPSSPITDYTIQYKLAADSTWLNFIDGVTNVTGAIVTGLTNDASYNFRAFAVNAVGPSLASNIATATPVSGSVSPEAGAAGHWLLGSDNPTMADLTTGKVLTPNNVGSTPVQNSGYLTLPGVTSAGLNTPIADAATITMIGVVRHNYPAVNSNGVVFFGSLASVGGSSVYYASSQPTLQWAVRPDASTTFGDAPAGEWHFVALSIDADSYLRFVGGSEAHQSSEVSATEKLPFAGNVCIGRSELSGTSFNRALDCAEFMVFPAGLTSAQLAAIYTRSVARLAARGITVA